MAPDPGPLQAALLQLYSLHCRTTIATLSALQYLASSPPPSSSSSPLSAGSPISLFDALISNCTVHDPFLGSSLSESAQPEKDSPNDCNHSVLDNNLEEDVHDALPHDDIVELTHDPEKMDCTLEKEHLSGKHDFNEKHVVYAKMPHEDAPPNSLSTPPLPSSWSASPTKRLSRAKFNRKNKVHVDVFNASGTDLKGSKLPETTPPEVLEHIELMRMKYADDMDALSNVLDDKSWCLFLETRQREQEELFSQAPCDLNVKWDFLDEEGLVSPVGLSVQPQETDKMQGNASKAKCFLTPYELGACASSSRLSLAACDRVAKCWIASAPL